MTVVGASVVGDVVPSGLVALLFTDVQGSTRLWAADTEAMSRSLRLHEVIVREAVGSHGGVVFSTAGDSFAVVFARASEAVDAAVEVQRLLGEAVWGDGPVLRVRMGVHVGECEERDGNYFGPTVNTAARVSACGHGGQVVITDAVRQSTQVLVVDLGDHELRDVDGVYRLFQVGDGVFPVLRTSSSSVLASSLPVPRTSLVGREGDVVEVRRLLMSNRLVTLTGVGGCGKTRLAIEVAHREIPSAPGGVWFVDLSTVADDSGVTGAFAAALGLVTAADADVSVEVVRYLAGRDGLVVVDNCEHVLDEAAELIDAILAGSSQMRVIATSRESLEIDGEQAWRVASLAGGLASPAVQLFIERAAAVGGQISNVAMGAVVEICERLDGIPLAIELAAARARSMDVVEIRDRLDDRFGLLSGGKRRSRQLQQTLEATVQWSFDLLGPDEQDLLCRLAVFQGGFDVADVALVADITPRDAIDRIDSLVAKSLIDITRDSQGSLRRRLLETIRMYAMGRLIDRGDAVASRDRHLERFLDDPTVTDWAAYVAMTGHHRVFRELDNFRAAASWALERDRPDATVRIACVLFEGLPLRGEHDLALHWLQLPATLTPADHIRSLVMTSLVLRERLDMAGATLAALDAITLADGVPHQALPDAYTSLATTIAGALARPEDVSPALAHAYAPFAATLQLPTFEKGLFTMEESLSIIERALTIAVNTPTPSASLATAYLFRSLFRIGALDFDGSVADADTLMRLRPDYAYRPLAEAMRACALHFAGHNELAQHAIEQFSPPSPLSSLTYGNTIAAAIVASRQIGPDQAAMTIAAEAREYVKRQPNTIGDWLKAFAVVAIERNDMRHAIELAATMSSGVTNLFLGWIATQAFSSWPGDDLDEHLERLMNAISPPADQAQALLDNRARLFAEELERWS